MLGLSALYSTLSVMVMMALSLYAVKGYLDERTPSAETFMWPNN